jgi:hypothetical protein
VAVSALSDPSSSASPSRRFAGSSRFCLVLEPGRQMHCHIRVTELVVGKREQAPMPSTAE